MDGTPIHIDEFGSIRFKVYSEDGASYEFEQEADSDLLFITVRDGLGRAEAKKVVNTTHGTNREIVQVYENYIREQDDTGKKDSSDDR